MKSALTLNAFVHGLDEVCDTNKGVKGGSSVISLNNCKEWVVVPEMEPTMRNKFLGSVGCLLCSCSDGVGRRTRTCGIQGTGLGQDCVAAVE